MKKALFALMFVCFISFSLAGIDGVIGLDLGSKPTDIFPGGNYSINVNHSYSSDYASNAGLFDDYSVAGLYTYYKGLLETYFDGVYCKLTGCTIDGVTIDNGDINNVDDFNMTGTFRQGEDGNMFIYDIQNELHHVNVDLGKFDELRTNTFTTDLTVETIHNATGDYINISATDGGRISFIANYLGEAVSESFDESTYILELTAGTNETPILNRVYAYISGGEPVWEVSLTDPAFPHAMVARVLMGDTGNYPYASALQEDGNNGFVKRVQRTFRKAGLVYEDGLEYNATTDYLEVGEGNFINGIYDQYVAGGMNTSDGFYIIHSDGSYHWYDSFTDITEYSDGTTIGNNKYFNVVFGVTPYDGKGNLYAVVQSNPTSGDYTGVLEAYADNDNTLKVFPSQDFLKIFFLPVARVIINKGDEAQILPNGAYAEDYRGGIAGGASSGGGLTEADPIWAAEKAEYAKYEFGTENFAGNGSFTTTGNITADTTFSNINTRDENGNGWTTSVREITGAGNKSILTGYSDGGTSPIGFLDNGLYLLGTEEREDPSLFWVDKNFTKLIAAYLDVDQQRLRFLPTAGGAASYEFSGDLEATSLSSVKDVTLGTGGKLSMSSFLGELGSIDTSFITRDMTIKTATGDVIVDDDLIVNGELDVKTGSTGAFGDVGMKLTERTLFGSLTYPKLVPNSQSGEWSILGGALIIEAGSDPASQDHSYLYLGDYGFNNYMEFDYSGVDNSLSIGFQDDFIVESDTNIIGNLNTTENITASQLTISNDGYDDFVAKHDEYGYPGFFGAYGDFFLGISSDPSIYFNYYNGENIIMGEPGNTQWLRLYGNMDATDNIKSDGYVWGVNGLISDALAQLRDGAKVTGDLNVTGLIYGNGSQLTDLPEANLTGYAEYQFDDNDFNGSGDFNTTGNIKVNNITIGDPVKLWAVGDELQIGNDTKVHGDINFTGLLYGNGSQLTGLPEINTTPTSGDFGFWKRVGTSIRTATSGDDVVIEGSFVSDEFLVQGFGTTYPTFRGKPNYIQFSDSSFSPNFWEYKIEATSDTLEFQDNAFGLNNGFSFNDDIQAEGAISVGSNTLGGLSAGDINVSTVYYDTLTAKSPMFMCSDNWCSVSFPKQQKTLYIQKDDNYNVLDIVYDDVHYTKSEFNTQICSLNEKTTEICTRLNDKVKKLSEKATCNNAGYEYTNGNCFEEIKQITTYANAITTKEVELYDEINTTCQRLGSDLQVEIYYCTKNVPNGQMQTQTIFKEGCDWNVNDGYYCIIKQEVIL